MLTMYTRKKVTTNCRLTAAHLTHAQRGKQVRSSEIARPKASTLHYYKCHLVSKSETLERLDRQDRQEQHKQKNKLQAKKINKDLVTVIAVLTPHPHVTRLHPFTESQDTIANLYFLCGKNRKVINLTQ